MDKAQLNSKLSDSLVQQRPGQGGKQLNYIPGRYIINQANGVFGFDGWDLEIVEPPTMAIVKTMSRNREAGEAKAYRAKARVTVYADRPIVREGTGWGTVRSDTVDGHESAMKAAETDAMKRALRTFGNQFGNGLNDNQPAQQQQQPRDRSNVPTEPRRILDSVNRQFAHQLPDGDEYSENDVLVILGVENWGAARKKYGSWDNVWKAIVEYFRK